MLYNRISGIAVPLSELTPRRVRNGAAKQQEVQVMAQQGVSRSINTAKWAKTLERAITGSLDVLIEPISCEAFVESASRPGVLYEVSAPTFSCPAGHKGQICERRACSLSQIGALPLEPTMVDCTACCGCGVQDYGRYALPCETCGGTGRIPALPAPPETFTRVTQWRRRCRCHTPYPFEKGY
jgi:hypothetical protein